jgi:hypothetical protein
MLNKGMNRYRIRNSAKIYLAPGGPGGMITTIADKQFHNRVIKDNMIRFCMHVSRKYKRNMNNLFGFAQIKYQMNTCWDSFFENKLTLTEQYIEHVQPHHIQSLCRFG